MEDLSSLNGQLSDHEGGVLSFLTAPLVDSGLSLSPALSAGLSFCPGLTP